MIDPSSEALAAITWDMAQVDGPLRARLENRVLWDSCVAGIMIQALDVGTRAAGPDGQDRPEDEALSVGFDG